MSCSLPTSAAFRWGMALAGAVALALAIRPYPLGLLAFTVGFFFVSSARAARRALEGAAIGAALAAVVAAGALTFIYVAMRNFWQVSVAEGAVFLLIYGAFSTPELPFFFALAPAAARLARDLPGSLKPLFWAALYTGLEFVFLKLRTSHHEVAYPLMQYRLLAPIAGLAGPPLLGYLAFACGSAVSYLAWPSTRTARRINCLTPFPLLAVALLWGLGGAQNPAGETLRAGLVQINEHDKELLAERGDAGALRELGDELIAASKSLIHDAHPALVLWPETAIPVPVNMPAGDALLARARALAREAGTPLLIGALERRGELLFNSAIFVSAAGEASVVYRKSHLFPYGETVPLANFFPSLYRFNPEARDFREGPGPVPVTLSIAGRDFRVGIMICQETQIPEYVRELSLGGTDFLVNLGKDSWFGTSDEPAYHFNESAARATETGLPMLRATNSGYSGLLLPGGGRTVLSGLFERATGVVELPLGPAHPTPYLRFGDWFAWVCVMVSLGALACYFIGKRPEPLS